MSQRTLITGAQVVFPEGIRAANVLVEGHQILAIDPPSTARVDETVNAKGLHLIPGVIDDQVHFREPGFEHKEDLHTGSLACAKGGVTTFLEMPNTNPATVTIEALHDKLERAASKCVVNFGFYIGATAENVDVLQQAKRTPGIKIFIGSSTGNLLVDSQAALERIFAETTLPICAHCEDESTVRANRERIGSNPSLADHSKIRDHAAALIATQRAVDLAIRYKHRFHVLHVSTAQEVEFLRGRPDWVTAEACPHHLFFQIEDYDRLGSQVQMNPSIKTAADNVALWEGLRSGVIEVIATDHAPHTLEEKAQAYPKSPSGLPAVENSLALMLDASYRGLCTLEQVVAWMCAAPARVWDIKNKGAIREGFDADLVLVDLAKRQTIRNEEQLTKSQWSPWHGVELTGWPVRTWVRGQTVFQNGKVDSDVRGAEAEYQR
ncbi:dihydroorotase [Planctomicrobium piriforme]|uniref:Dihydroorotase n=1 Tax=Planctomicrobium piriforme TaxID=1576369 RepID=A0A1I3HKS1_9PLAN|nr:dihydroorotase [Planctomicrobium piriforme]SFI36233.1 dihydroorotase [Planctomicrobium piriforme]